MKKIKQWICRDGKKKKKVLNRGRTWFLIFSFSVWETNSKNAKECLFIRQVGDIFGIYALNLFMNTSILLNHLKGENI